MTEETAAKAIGYLNTVYNAAIVNLPTGLVPLAKEAQMKGLQEAAQGLVDIIEAQGPLPTVKEE